MDEMVLAKVWHDDHFTDTEVLSIQACVRLGAPLHDRRTGVLLYFPDRAVHDH